MENSSSCNLSKIITLSMWHISSPTNWLIHHIYENHRKNIANIGLKACYGFDEGYIIYISENWDENITPDDLRNCVNYALKNGCKWIHFTYHTEPISILKTYDPDNGTDLNNLIVNGKIKYYKDYENNDVGNLDEVEEWFPYDDIDD